MKINISGFEANGRHFAELREAERGAGTQRDTVCAAEAPGQRDAPASVTDLCPPDAAGTRRWSWFGDQHRRLIGVDRAAGHFRLVQRMPD